MSTTQRAVVGREMPLVPVFAAILCARLAYLPRKVPHPLQIDQQPRDDEQQDDVGLRR